MSQPPLNLPGISAEYCERAELCHVSADAALQLCGIRESGMLIPYRNFYGERIEYGDLHFCRLRLDNPRGDQKYHQPSGSAPHAYLPPSIWEENKTLNSPIIVVEGEKKALALAEEGYTAIGIGGFFNFRESNGLLVEEIEEVRCREPDAGFIFFGDSDVIFNSQFAHAALSFAQLVRPSKVIVSCVPHNAPGKGVDDCRAALRNKFRDWSFTCLFEGVMVETNSTSGTIALELLRRQQKHFPALREAAKEEVIKGLSRLAAGLRAYPLEHHAVIEIAYESVGAPRRFFNNLVKEEVRCAALSLTAKSDDDHQQVINLSEQPGAWTRRALQVLGQVTYLYGEQLCKLDKGKFAALNAASLVPLLDAPDCCRFIRTNAAGIPSPTNLGEKDARLILGALLQHEEVLQPVETLAQVPVLAWTPAGPQIIAGYSREQKILATAGTIELPEPTAAAEALLSLTRDFDFVTAGDTGRAIAFLLTMALVNGRFLDSGRAPFFMIEKDQKGAGAGTFFRMVAALYGARPCTVTPDDPKAAREDISKHLLAGANLVNLDNIRGKVLTSLPFFESLLTEPIFTCRAPYEHGTVDVTRRVFACTSNGAVLSSDLADRAVRITLRKRPDNHAFHPWPEGDLIEHVIANRLQYLACIYSLVQAWALQGRPPGSQLSGFRFPQWERACVWILETFFGSLPLIDADHQTAQQRMATPDFDLLRALFRAVLDRGEPSTVSATDLARVGVELGRLEGDEKSLGMKMGRILTREFPQDEAYDFAREFRVVRRKTSGADSNHEPIKTYWVSPLPGKHVNRNAAGAFPVPQYPVSPVQAVTANHPGVPPVAPQTVSS